MLINKFKLFTMLKSSFVRARIEPEIKTEAEYILHEMGISPSQAIVMLYKYLAREHKWPVPLNIPNAKTIKTFKDTDNKVGLTHSKDSKEMFKKLGI